MTNEQIAQRAVENAETAAQLEITDAELRDSLIRSVVQELNKLTQQRDILAKTILLIQERDMSCPPPVTRPHREETP